MTIQPSQIGPYTVERELGRGGMGVVYLARDSGLGRSVAIKAVPAEWQHDAERMGRFEREARLLASMNHPNIASVYGLQEHEGQKYLVMEFVAGRSLADTVRADGALPVDEALAVGAQIAGAMEAAHDAGIVHRDLKPGNVIVTPEGRAKVLDFGLAKGSAAPGSSMVSDPQSPTLTTPRAREVLSATGLGRVLGTVGYMSPEQARGKPVDKRADIWALGCVLFEMLTAQRAFDGETQTDAIAAILEREPDWKALPANTPPRVRELLAKCLTKDVSRRQRDAGDARLELEKALANREWTNSFIGSASALGVPATRSAGRHWLSGVLLALVGAGVGVGAGALLWPRAEATGPAERERVCFELALNIPKTEPEHGRSLLFARLSPDGSEVLCEFALPGARLAVHRFDGFTTELLANTEGASNPVWSPDGRSIAFFTPAGGLSRMSRAGGPPQVVVERVRSDGGALWLTDGRILLRSEGGVAISAVPENGGPITEWLVADRSKGVGGYDSLAQVPGQQYMLAGAYFDNAIDSYRIMSIDMKTGAAREVLPRGAAPLPAPPDRMLFVRDSSLFCVPFDFATGRVTGEERMIVGGVRAGDWGGGAMFDATLNGVFLYAPGRRGVVGRQIVRVDREGKATPIQQEPLPYYELLAVSADGRWGAVTTLRRRMEFWLIDLESGGRTLIDDSSEVYRAAFSPDADKLAYTSIRTFDGDAPPRVLVWDKATGRSTPVDLPSDGVWWVSSWVPKREALLVNRTSDLAGSGNSQVLLVPLGADAPKPIPLTEPTGFAWTGRASPDGAWVAYTADAAGRSEIFLRPIGADGRAVRVSRDGGRSVEWNGPGEITWWWRQQLFSATFSVENGTPKIGPPRPVMQHPFAGATNVQSPFPTPAGDWVTIQPSEQERDPAPVRVIKNWDGGPVE